MTAMLFSLGYEGTGKTPEPEVARPEVVRVRERGARQEPSPKTRKMTRLTETVSRATGTGSSATDDVSSVILGNLIQNPLFYATAVLHLLSATDRTDGRTSQPLYEFMSYCLKTDRNIGPESHF